MTKYTPGPWIYSTGSVYVADPLDEDGYPAGVRIALADRKEPETSGAERDANAQLCAAAPDLLDSLRFILDAADTEPGMSIYKAHIQAGRAAIAKAEGRS